MNNIDIINQSELPSLPMDTEILNPDYYVMHYQEFIPMYISNGKPSLDTLKTYYSAINQFIKWCVENRRHPLAMHNYQMRIYQQYLINKKYKDDSIAVKFIAIKLFFHVAIKLELITENPCEDIKTSSSFAQDEMIQYYSTDQIIKICEVFKNEENSFIKYRNMAIVYLMAIEGLRCVEVHRANREDINWNIGIIYIKGKGHNRQIYPCDQTFKILDKYLSFFPLETTIKKENNFTPLFLSNSGNNIHGRISRNGLRYILNNALSNVNLKVAGASCHVLRHSCGTNLYAAKKDLRLVQDVLGHRDPKTTARYAHLHNRISNRSTEVIAPTVI